MSRLVVGAAVTLLLTSCGEIGAAESHGDGTRVEVCEPQAQISEGPRSPSTASEPSNMSSPGRAVDDLAAPRVCVLVVPEASRPPAKPPTVEPPGSRAPPTRP